MVKYRCNVNQCIRQKKDKNVYLNHAKFMNHLLHQHTQLELAIHLVELEKGIIVDEQ